MIMQLKLPMSAVQILRLFCIISLSDAKEHGCVLVDSNFSTFMRVSRHSVKKLMLSSIIRALAMKADEHAHFKQSAGLCHIPQRRRLGCFAVLINAAQS